jgi:hypothetical protein
MFKIIHFSRQAHHSRLHQSLSAFNGILSLYITQMNKQTNNITEQEGDLPPFPPN